MTRGLPWISPCTNCGKVFWLTTPPSTSTKAMVAFLSESGRAAKTGSMAPAPRSFSLATARWVLWLEGSVVDLISVISRSARKFVKKLIQPLYRATNFQAQYARATAQPHAGGPCVRLWMSDETSAIRPKVCHSLGLGLRLAGALRNAYRSDTVYNSRPTWQTTPP